MLSLANQYGPYGVDMLLNAAGSKALNPDGAYEMTWPEEREVADAMVDAGLLLRYRDEVTATPAGRAAADREMEAVR